jgi:small-conductance mechanosensitive channel
VGAWIQSEAVPGVTWLQIVAGAALIVVLAAAWLVLRAMVRRWLRHRALEPTRHTEAASDRAALVKLAVEAAIPPAGLLVWVWGVYATLRLLLVHLVAGAPNSPAILALDWLRYVGNVTALFWLIFRLISVVEVRLQRWAATATKWDDVLAVVMVRALRLITPLAGVILVLPALPIPSEYSGLFRQATSLVLVAAVGFILYELVNSGESAVLAQFRIDESDNLRARKVYTQVKVLKKIAVAVIVIFTFASMLMVFEPVRQLGASILASAGVVGIIVGFAAQRSLATVLAGLQIALTQPIRLDDVVIVEGEWGRIEEINLLFVVVRIWDLRRLVVPITYFIEKPFQNWTRASADLLGSVFLYTDYTVPLDALRQELDRVLEDSKLWDRKVKVLQVTDAKERTVEVRVLVSAADSSAAWDLRCQVREKLVSFLQRSFPQCLPRTRAELTPMPKLTE